MLHARARLQHARVYQNFLAYNAQVQDLASIFVRIQQEDRADLAVSEAERIEAFHEIVNETYSSELVH